jgi:hypothetical protein
MEVCLSSITSLHLLCVVTMLRYLRSLEHILFFPLPFCFCSCLFWSSLFLTPQANSSFFKTQLFLKQELFLLLPRWYPLCIAMILSTDHWYNFITGHLVIFNLCIPPTHLYFASLRTMAHILFIHNWIPLSQLNYEQEFLIVIKYPLFKFLCVISFKNLSM